MINLWFERKVITIEKFSCLKKLLRVTGYVSRFVRNLRRCLDGKEKVIGELVAEDLGEAERLWLSHEQTFIVNNSSFEKRKVSLNLFYDEFNLLRPKTRMNNVNDIHFRKSEPILLRNNSHFTKLIIKNIHVNVHHSGVASTLTKLRPKFWLVKGRSSVKKVINRCIICKFIHGKFILPPQLPKYKVCCEYPFENVSVDYAGEKYIFKIFILNRKKCINVAFYCLLALLRVACT